MNKSIKKDLGLNIGNNYNQPQQPIKNFNHIVQIKNELVKMKEFLNKQLPSLNELIPHRNHISQQSIPPVNNLSDQELHQIVTVNRKLKYVNSQLAQELLRQKKQKRQLSKSLKKQQKMLSKLYKVSHNQLETYTPRKQWMEVRNGSQSKEKISKNLYHQYNSLQKQHTRKAKKQDSMQTSRSSQKVHLIHIRKASKNNSQIIFSDPSIHKQLIISNKPSFDYDNSDMGPSYPQTPQAVQTPQYSQADLTTMEIIKQIDVLQSRMNDLMRQSKMTQNKSKKLQIRTQLQRISNKIHYLKDYLEKPFNQ